MFHIGIHNNQNDILSLDVIGVSIQTGRGVWRAHSATRKNDLDESRKGNLASFLLFPVPSLSVNTC